MGIVFTVVILLMISTFIMSRIISLKNHITAFRNLTVIDWFIFIFAIIIYAIGLIVSIAAIVSLI